MKNIILLSFFLLTVTFVYPQSRKAFKGNKQTNSIIYKRGTIKLFAGQRVTLLSPTITGKLKEITLQDTSRSVIKDFGNMSTAIEQLNSEKNICIDFNTIFPEEGKAMTVLLIKNPYRKRMTYKARIYSTAKGRFIKANVLPVMPGISGIITWQESVSPVLIYGLRVSKD